MYLLELMSCRHEISVNSRASIYDVKFYYRFSLMPAYGCKTL